jgi:hypothetical protein
MSHNDKRRYDEGLLTESRIFKQRNVDIVVLCGALGLRAVRTGTSRHARCGYNDGCELNASTPKIGIGYSKGRQPPTKKAQFNHAHGATE